MVNTWVTTGVLENVPFLFNKKTDPTETRNVVSNEFLKDELSDIKIALISHLKENGEIGGIVDNEWRNYTVPSFIKDPDEGDHRLYPGGIVNKELSKIMSLLG